MDLNRIRYFLSLARTGSVSRAAELHSISAAAFSKSMKIFESEVGRKLLLPQGRGIVLTDYAKSIVPNLQSILQQIDAIREQSNSPADNSDTLRIATFEVFSTHFLTQTVRTYFPNVRCEIHEMIPGKMEEAVASGRADLALTYLPIPHPDLDFLRVVDIEMGVYGLPSVIAEANIKEVKFAAPITPVEGSPNKVRGLDGWPDDAFPRNIQYQVQMLETALGLCRQGLAVAYIPKFIATLHNDFVQPTFHLSQMSLPRGFPKERAAVFLIKRKSDQEGYFAKKLALAVRKICR